MKEEIIPKRHRSLSSFAPKNKINIFENNNEKENYESELNTNDKEKNIKIRK